MPEKKKRPYTFTKNQIFPYPSGGIVHETVKANREALKNLDKGLTQPRTRKKRF